MKLVFERTKACKIIKVKKVTVFLAQGSVGFMDRFRQLQKSSSSIKQQSIISSLNWLAFTNDPIMKRKKSVFDRNPESLIESRF